MPHMPLATKVTAVGGERFLGAAPGALAGGFGRRQRVLNFSGWALHGSCPIDAQHPQHQGQGDGYEPQGEGEKGVHGLGSSVTGCPGHPPFFL